MTDLSLFRETFVDPTRAEAFTALMAELDDGMDPNELTDSDVALIRDGVFGEIPGPAIWFESDVLGVLA